MIEVMLVDDHSIVRQGIKSMLAHEPDIQVVAEADNGRKALELAQAKSPDVIVMDISLPYLNGFDTSLQILKHKKQIKIIVLSMHESRTFVEKALACGLKGYLLKDNAADEIVQAIREVYAGRYFLSSKLSSLLVQDYVAKKKKPLRVKGISVLTGREREVMQLIAEGFNNKEIAQKLEVSLKTVMVHRNNVMQKLDLHNQAQLIRLALKEGLSSI